jgi:hypothetical protein
MPRARIGISAGVTTACISAATVESDAGIDRGLAHGLSVTLGLHVANPLRSIIAGVITRIVYGLRRLYKDGDGGKNHCKG